MSVHWPNPPRRSGTDVPESNCCLILLLVGSRFGLYPRISRISWVETGNMDPTQITAYFKREVFGIRKSRETKPYRNKALLDTNGASQILKTHIYKEQQSTFYVLTLTIFVLSPTIPAIFSSVSTYSDITHFWVVTILWVMIQITSCFLSSTCCSNVWFRFIVLKMTRELKDIKVVTEKYFVY